VELRPNERTRPIIARLTPSMPVEAYIVTGEYITLDNLRQPVEASFQRAFREH
jgi:hypothetical protein